MGISLKLPPLSTMAFICGLTLLAALVRVWPLGLLENKLAWITFYPIVIISALFGGRAVGGIFAAILSILIVSFWSPVDEPFIQGAPGIIGTIVFFFNCTVIAFISDRMLSTRELAEELQIEAEKANQAKSNFLANMSHELRTPLNAIIGFSQILRKSAVIPRKELDQIGIINKSGEHLLQIVNDVLTMSKIEAGQSKLELAPTNFKDLLNDIVDIMRVRADAKSLPIQIQIEDNVPEYIEVDSGKLRQIYINFLSNAVKFTDKGSVTVKVGCRDDEAREEGKTVIFGELTASALQERQQDALDAGADDTFNKPFKIEEIFESMKHYLDIEYIYENDEPSTSHPKNTTQESKNEVSLALLPADLLNSLNAAELGGDGEQVKTLLTQMPDTHQEWSQQFNKLLGGYRFDRIVELLDVAIAEGQTNE